VALRLAELPTAPHGQHGPVWAASQVNWAFDGNPPPRATLNMSAHGRVAWLLVTAIACARTSQVPDGYASRISFPLTPGPDRMQGRLELLEDVRIRPSMREAIRQAWGDDPCAGPATPALRSLCDAAERLPLRPALLRLVDRAGQVVATEAAPRPLADLSVARLHGSERRTYLLTVDLSSGAGSYSGPYTRLAEPAGHSFGWVVAVDTLGVGADTITLVRTLKTAWRAVPRSDVRGQDLLMVRCRPELDAPDSVPETERFILRFDRYTYDGARWVHRQRQERGFWEDEGPESFPDRTRFP
jgi:hypothetical protein